jgi:hypothetical protein
MTRPLRLGRHRRTEVKGRNFHGWGRVLEAFPGDEGEIILRRGLFVGEVEPAASPVRRGRLGERAPDRHEGLGGTRPFRLKSLRRQKSMILDPNLATGTEPEAGGLAETGLERDQDGKRPAGLFERTASERFGSGEAEKRAIPGPGQALSEAESHADAGVGSGADPADEGVERRPRKAGLGEEAVDEAEEAFPSPAARPEEEAALAAVGKGGGDGLRRLFKGEKTHGVPPGNGRRRCAHASDEKAGDFRERRPDNPPSRASDPQRRRDRDPLRGG